jgi:hypothetical protein
MPRTNDATLQKRETGLDAVGARPVLLKVYISGGIYAQPFLNERLHVTRGGYL